MTDIAEKYGIDLGTIGKTACPRCRSRGQDNAGNNLHVYGIGRGAYCWACDFTIASDEHKEEMGWEDEDEDVEVMTRERITQEEYEQVKKYTGTKGHGYRGIEDETNKFYGVRYEYDEETGAPVKQYIPTTIDGKMAGFKTRVFPKDFTNPIGTVGIDTDMIGEYKFKNHGRTVLIVGGETKMLNAYQMLKNDLENRGKEGYETVAVVCPSVGETGAWKQIQKRYEFFNQFDKIIVCMDSDKPGEAATEKIAGVLPKGKVFVMKMRYKDADDYVVDKAGNAVGKEREFIKDFWNSKPYTPSGVLGSGDLASRIREEVSTEKVSFPPFMRLLNEKTANGIGLGKIVNIGAASGIGKTTIVDTLVYHWVFNSPHLIGIVSMELNAGQYGTSMLSRHIRRKINNIADPIERLKFLDQDWVKEAEAKLWYRPDGTNRFYLLDDRDGTLEQLKEKVEQLVIGCGVKVIVLDPLQDILDGLTNEEQALFLKWQKGLIKSHGMTFININHVRKSGSGGQQNSNGGMISEEDFAGSSTIFKSAALNILLVRDKMNPDEVERNTVKSFISKNRDNGNTGPADDLYYDNETHQLMNKLDWLEKQPPVEY